MELRKTAHINAEQLKLLAILAMVIDHCAVALLPQTLPGMWALRMIGRLTAPIMCYFIAEGYHHTSNLRRYMGRLLLMVLISHIPHNLMLGQDVFLFWQCTSVMVSLLCGLLALTAWKSKRIPHLWQKVLLVGLCCLLSYSANWNYIVVLWILGFGIFRGDFKKQTLAFCAVALIYLAQPVLYSQTFPAVSRLGVFLVLPLLYIYNGQRGKHRGWLSKWGFYWFYPLHQLAIWGIAQVI